MTRRSKLVFSAKDIFGLLALVALFLAYRDLQVKVTNGFSALEKSQAAPYRRFLSNPIEYSIRVLADSRDETILLVQAKTMEPHALSLKINERSLVLQSLKESFLPMYSSEVCILINRFDHEGTKVSFNTKDVQLSEVMAFGLDQNIDEFVEYSNGGVSKLDIVEVFRWTSQDCVATATVSLSEPH